MGSVASLPLHPPATINASRGKAIRDILGLLSMLSFAGGDAFALDPLNFAAHDRMLSS
jgi:hypothetical protein